MDDGRHVSLILMPPPAASFGPKPSRADCVTLYRHKWSRISKILYRFGIVIVDAGDAERFYQEFLKKRRSSKESVFKRWILQFVHRSFLLSGYRDEKEMSFAEPPEFSLLWAESGNSVAVLLNGEPWAFVSEKSDKGYSKGILKPGYKNVWDQELFEKVFPK